MWKILSRMITIIVTLVCVISQSAFALAQPQKLQFEKNKDVKYIYCNNHEALRKENVVNLPESEMSDKSWIMSLTDLEAGKYVMFVSHLNETSYDRYSDGYSQNAKSDYIDIVVDALFTSRKGAKVKVNRGGYYATSGVDESVSCLKAFADYLCEPIKELPVEPHSTLYYDQNCIGRDARIYYPEKLTGINKDISFSSGKTGWLGEVLPDQEVCHCSGMVFMMVEFEVYGQNGCSVDLDIGALKVKESSPGIDRTIRGDVKPGEFINEACIKGVADCAPEVTANLDYVIDDSDTALPVLVSNTAGNDILIDGVTPGATHFISYANSAEDGYGSSYMYVDNDMLSFSYNDINGEHEFAIDKPWNAGGVSCATLGNFGVTQVYNISITNTASFDRYLKYEAVTATNYLVSLESTSLSPTREKVKYVDSDGFSLFARGEVQQPQNNGYLFAIDPVELIGCPLPAGETTNVTLKVMSTTNVFGGIQSRFNISDTPFMGYDTDAVNDPQSVEKDDIYYTGKEYLTRQYYQVYENGKTKPFITNKIAAEFADNLALEFRWTGNSYLAFTTNVYPIYRLWGSNLYEFSEDMDKLLNTWTVPYHIKDIQRIDGTYYAVFYTDYGRDKTSVWYSDDLQNWKEFSKTSDGVLKADKASRALLPLTEYADYEVLGCKRKAVRSDAASVLNGTITPIAFETLEPIEFSYLGNRYRAVCNTWDGTQLYYSRDGIYWTIDDSVYPDDTVYVKLKDKYLGFEVAPVIESDRTLVPIRFLFESMGAVVEWDDMTQSAEISQNGKAIGFIINDNRAWINGQEFTMDVPARLINNRTMVPLRFISENLGYNVEWDEATRTAIIN